MPIPNNKKTMHTPRSDKETTTFAECLRDSCPFYYTIKGGWSRSYSTEEHCKRAEKESEGKE